MKFNYKKLIIFIVLLCCLTIVHADDLITNPDIPTGTINSCEELLGPNLSAVVKAGIIVLQIAGAIIAVVRGMMTLIPPIISKDSDALKKAGKTLTKMAVVLIVIFLLKPLLTFIGDLLDFDTSCLI